MIRNGQIAEPVRDVTLSGNVFQTLADIEAIGMTSTGMNPAAVARRRAAYLWVVVVVPVYGLAMSLVGRLGRPSAFEYNP